MCQKRICCEAVKPAARAGEGRGGRAAARWRHRLRFGLCSLVTFLLFRWDPCRVPSQLMGAFQWKPAQSLGDTVTPINTRMSLKTH